MSDAAGRGRAPEVGSVSIDRAGAPEICREIAGAVDPQSSGGRLPGLALRGE